MDPQDQAHPDSTTISWQALALDGPIGLSPNPFYHRASPALTRVENAALAVKAATLRAVASAAAEPRSELDSAVWLAAVPVLRAPRDAGLAEVDLRRLVDMPLAVLP